MAEAPDFFAPRPQRKPRKPPSLRDLVAKWPKAAAERRRQIELELDVALGGAFPAAEIGRALAHTYASNEPLNGMLARRPKAIREQAVRDWPTADNTDRLGTALGLASLLGGHVHPTVVAQGLDMAWRIDRAKRRQEQANGS